MTAIRVLLVDDHPVVREGLQSLLSQYGDIQVVGEAEDSVSALDQCSEVKPDVILLDIRLNAGNGLHLVRQLRQIQTDARIIVLTSYDDEAYLLEGAQLGVHGYFLKSTSADILAEAIRAAHAGERRLSPLMTGKALEQLGALQRAQLQAKLGLSDQDLLLLHMIAQGATTQTIADALFISQRTVKRKTQDVMAKLGAVSRAQAVAEAFRRGLL